MIMYIAFKWLVALALMMWLSLCFMDCFLNRTSIPNKPGLNKRMINNNDIVFKNTTAKAIQTASIPNKDNIISNVESTMAFYYITMFIVGAMTVSAFHKQHDIILLAQYKLWGIISNNNNFNTRLQKFKITALHWRVAIIEHLQFFWENIRYHSLRIIKIFRATNSADRNRVQAILIQKFKEIRDQRQRLGQLLIAAIQENKNIRMRYQLESISNNRLVQSIEYPQKEIKENYFKFFNFQHLYLVTYQENNFLKARIRKLTKDKDDAEKNLIELIKEVYKSRNKELRAYCSRFIVKTKNNLLNSDVNTEINKFLEKTRDLENNCQRSRVCITEMLQDDKTLSRLTSDEPRLRGLPGEYVWTVKDKNGIIEKLYEYDFESCIDNGDTIKRIRQYSVYFDKDCLLDFSKKDQESETSLWRRSNCRLNALEYPISNQNIVTGSKAFQTFLRNNNSIVPIK